MVQAVQLYKGIVCNLAVLLHEDRNGTNKQETGCVLSLLTKCCIGR